MIRTEAYRRVLWIGLSLVAALALALPAEAVICIGRTCGADMGFPIEHCHIRPGDSLDTDEVCWSSELDFACEELGFEQAILCPTAADGPVGGVAGAVGQQGVVLSGYNQFRSQIVRPATARMAERDAAAEAEEEGEGEDGEGEAGEGEDGEGEEGEEEAGYGVHLSEISTALEYEDWELGGLPGETVGLRFDWLRETATGVLVGASASYQDASPDQGESTELLNGQLSFGHTLGGGGDTEWSWAAFGTVSDISGPVSDTLFGGGARIGFARYFPGGQVFSGGVLGQYQTADELDDDLVNVGAGAAFGFPVGQRFALDFEAYAVSIVEPDVADDSFYTGAGMFSVYFSPRFTLTLGARVLEGIEDLDSITYTLGSSTRFW